MTAAFITFGCKLNQFETEALASTFAGQGFSVVPAAQPADLYVINTCTVTSRGEQKARRLIRGLARRHPGALLVVTGCYAQVGADELAGLAPNVRVVPQSTKSGLLDLPRLLREAGAERALPAAGFQPLPGSPGADPFRYQPDVFRFHTRAFLKIQDGCHGRCAYCRVPLARGSAVGLDMREALERVAGLEKAGCREVVLTGVNISAWRSGGLDLAVLVRRILEETSRLRVRLSSLEPERISEGLAEVLQEPRICAHFHLPLQSGSAEVLRRMRRRYGPAEIIRAVERLRRAGRDPFLAADVIVGFPGETARDFAETRRLVERLELAALHVFPFSPRPGTEAFTMEPRVPERVRDERAAELLDLSARLLAAYTARWVGREEEAVLERRAGSAWKGVTGNYLKVRVTGVPEALDRAGRLARVLLGAKEALFLGEA